MHLSMPSNTGRGVIGASSKINKSISFIFYPTLLFGAILQLLPSLYGTGILKVEWMVRPNINNMTATPIHAATFALQPLATALFLIQLKRSVFLPPPEHPGMRLLSAIGEASLTVQNFLKDPSLLFIKQGFSLICFKYSLVLVNHLVIDNNILS